MCYRYQGPFKTILVYQWPTLRNARNILELKIQGSVFNTVEVTMPLTVEDADAIKENASDLVVEVLGLAEVWGVRAFQG